MQRTVYTVVVLFISLLLTICVAAQDRLTPTEAASYIGKNATVCGQVASATYAARSRGRPTFLNLDRPYPNPIFTALIWGEDRGKFSGSPEKTYSGKRILRDWHNLQLSQRTSDCCQRPLTNYHGIEMTHSLAPHQMRRPVETQFVESFVSWMQRAIWNLKR